MTLPGTFDFTLGGLNAVHGTFLTWACHDHLESAAASEFLCSEFCRDFSQAEKLKGT